MGRRGRERESGKGRAKIARGENGGEKGAFERAGERERVSDVINKPYRSAREQTPRSTAREKPEVKSSGLKLQSPRGYRARAARGKKQASAA